MYRRFRTANIPFLNQAIDLQEEGNKALLCHIQSIAERCGGGPDAAAGQVYALMPAYISDMELYWIPEPDASHDRALPAEDGIMHPGPVLADDD